MLGPSYFGPSYFGSSYFGPGSATGPGTGIPPGAPATPSDPYGTTTTAGLLAFCKFLARRPPNDAEVTDDEWYTLLSLAQEELYEQWMVHFPWLLLCDWTPLVTSDNVTWSFPGTVWPAGGFMVRVGLDGRFLSPGSSVEDDGDFVVLSPGTIRLADHRARSFGDTLHGRWIALPSRITPSTQPSLLPPHARVLIAVKACEYFAHRGGGQRDPKYYESMFQKRWTGNPMIAGDGGMMLALKNQAFGAQGGAPHFTPWSWG